MQFPRAISTYESTPLELQRFQILLNFHPTELHAKFWAQVTSTTANPPHAHGHHAFQRSPHRRSPLIPCVYNTDCPCLVHSSPSATTRRHHHRAPRPGLVDSESMFAMACARAPREPSRPRPRGYDEPDLRNNVPHTLHLQQTSPEREARGTFCCDRGAEATCPRRSPCE